MNGQLAVVTCRVVRHFAPGTDLAAFCLLLVMPKT
jgi:hypothetical protein